MVNGNKCHKAILKLGVIIKEEGWPNGEPRLRPIAIQTVLWRANVPLNFTEISMMVQLLGVARATPTARDYRSSDFCAAVKAYLEDREPVPA